MDAEGGMGAGDRAAEWEGTRRESRFDFSVASSVLTVASSSSAESHEEDNGGWSSFVSMGGLSFQQFPECPCSEEPAQCPAEPGLQQDARPPPGAQKTGAAKAR